MENHRASKGAVAPTGFINFGSTCFVNAVLQYVLHCPAVADLIKQHGPRLSHRKSSLHLNMLRFYKPFYFYSLSDPRNVDGVSVSVELMEGYILFYKRVSHAPTNCVISLKLYTTCLS